MMTASRRWNGVLLACTGVLFAISGAELPAASSVSQYGITWTFDADYPVGQYVNGDYYVVAPSGLNITKITPASTILATRPKEGGGTVTNSTVNGSMRNPLASNVATQGFDSNLNGSSGGYRAGQNVARPGGNDLSASNPMVVPTNSSIVSTISHPNANYRPALNDAAVLTVVSSAPPAGSFRPPYCGTDKTSYWNKSNLNYGILRSLAPVGTTPSLSAQEALVQRPWIEINTEANGRYFHPLNNQPEYGGDMSRLIGIALLSLHLNYSNAQKETLFIRLVQYGIDVYGAAKTGGKWSANGGHNLGRKMPMVLAGLALNDPNILEWADASKHLIFQEDLQTFVVDASQLLVIPYTGDGRVRLPYTAAMIGTPEWGEKHVGDRTRDGSNWGVYYRDVVYRALFAHALTAHLTPGAVNAWKWQVFFDYYDRVKTIAGDSNFGSFSAGMWNTYRSLSSVPIPTTVVPPSNAKVNITVQ